MVEYTVSTAMVEYIGWIFSFIVCSCFSVRLQFIAQCISLAVVMVVVVSLLNIILVILSQDTQKVGSGFGSFLQLSINIGIRSKMNNFFI
jgi:hypothetical protein